MEVLAGTSALPEITHTLRSTDLLLVALSGRYSILKACLLLAVLLGTVSTLSSNDNPPAGSMHFHDS